MLSSALAIITEEDVSHFFFNHMSIVGQFQRHSRYI